MEKMRKSMVELGYPLSGQTHARFHKHSIPPSNRSELILQSIDVYRLDIWMIMDDDHPSS